MAEDLIVLANQERFYRSDIDTNFRRVQAQTVNVEGQIGRNTAIIIPMYIYPWMEGTDYPDRDAYFHPAYSEVVNMAKRYHSIPFYVVINPPGDPRTWSSADANYAQVVKLFHGAGINVIGYVRTQWTQISEDTVKADVDAWYQYFSDIDGIFFDEMDNQLLEASYQYYENLSQYAKSKGFTITIGNPGADTPSGYFSDDGMDIIIIREVETYMSEEEIRGGYWSGSHMEFHYKRRAGIVHSMSTLNLQELARMRKYMGAIYITDDPYSGSGNILQPGTVSGTSGNQELSGDSSALFTENVRVGDDVVVDGNTYRVWSVVSDTQIILNTNLSTSPSGSNWYLADNPYDSLTQHLESMCRILASEQDIKVSSIEIESTPIISQPVFVSPNDPASINDCSFGGAYSGLTESTFEVEIDGQGSPDTFKWRKDSGSWTTGVAITGAEQTLSDGIKAKFVSTTGHSLAANWKSTIKIYSPIKVKDAQGTIILEVDNAGYLNMPNLPTSNPGGSGRIWNNGGTVTIT